MNLRSFKIALILIIGLTGGAFAVDFKHFHFKGKPASIFTIEVIKKARATMSFSGKAEL